MPRKFIYFINPISGTKDKAKLLEIIHEKTKAKEIIFEVLDTNALGDYGYLLEKIKTDQVTDIIVCGGDGTVNQVASAVLGMDVNIGIIPMGSGNGLALAAKIPRHTEKSLDIIFKGHSQYIDSFYINNKFSCMLSGLGFDAQVAHDFAKQGKRGLATYFRQSVKNFIIAKPYPFKLSIEGKTINTEAFFISIANSNQFGNNFTIAPQASLEDGLLDIVVVNKMSKMKMLLTLLKQLRSGEVRPYEDRKYQVTEVGYFQASALTIYNPDLAPLHIDGDPAVTSEEIEISIIEKAFRLIMPG